MKVDTTKIRETMGCLTSDHEPVLSLTLLTKLCDRIDELEEVLEHYKTACIKTQYEISQTLGKALGYPWLIDDQKNFPGATEDDGVCTGEHVAETLALEAAGKLIRYQDALENIKHYEEASDQGHVWQLARKALQKTEDKL